MSRRPSLSRPVVRERASLGTDRSTCTGWRGSSPRWYARRRARRNRCSHRRIERGRSRETRRGRGPAEPVLDSGRHPGPGRRRRLPTGICGADAESARGPIDDRPERRSSSAPTALIHPRRPRRPTQRRARPDSRPGRTGGTNALRAPGRKWAAVVVIGDSPGPAVLARALTGQLAVEVARASPRWSVPGDRSSSASTAGEVSRPGSARCS
jgi:hypothetical protein